MDLKNSYFRGEIVRQIATCEESRAYVFEAFASAHELKSIPSVAKETGLSEKCVASRVEELKEDGRIWPIGHCVDEQTGETFRKYTVNPNVALAFNVVACKDVINQFADFPQAQICLIVAIREYAILRNPTPHLIYDVDGTLTRVWKECVKPLIDEEMQP